MSPTATATRPTTRSNGATAQRRPPRRRRLLTLGVLALVVVLAATLGGLVYFSSVFGAQRVAVSGTRELTAAQVVDAAQVPIGRPLVRQDLSAITGRVLALPGVAEATVTRDWPTTLAVTVVERRPLLAIAQPQGYAIIDRHGVAYAVQPAVPKGVVPADVNPDNVALLTEVGIVASALPSGLKGKVERIAATDADDITLRLDSGVVVRWGSAEQSDLKAEVTSALLKGKPKSSIDVSSPHNPAMR